MQLLAEAKQIVRGLTDTEALLKGYDQGAESARRFTRSLPKTILRTWAEQFPRSQARGDSEAGIPGRASA